jgi:hypothetical protein
VAATADTVWAVPAYLPYLQPPLTAQAVASAEKLTETARIGSSRFDVTTGGSATQARH